jgi:hypothetical protein
LKQGIRCAANVQVAVAPTDPSPPAAAPTLPLLRSYQPTRIHARTWARVRTYLPVLAALPDLPSLGWGHPRRASPWVWTNDQLEGFLVARHHDCRRWLIAQRFATHPDDAKLDAIANSLFGPALQPMAEVDLPLRLRLPVADIGPCPTRYWDTARCRPLPGVPTFQLNRRGWRVGISLVETVTDKGRQLWVQALIAVRPTLESGQPRRALYLPDLRRLCGMDQWSGRVLLEDVIEQMLTFAHFFYRQHGVDVMRRCTTQDPPLAEVRWDDRLGKVRIEIHGRGSLASYFVLR